MRLLMVLALLVAGCSQASAIDVPVAPTAPGLKAGSRLSVVQKRLMGSDGSEIEAWTTTFHDKTLDEDCILGDHFREEVVRCVPAPVLQNAATFPGDLFANPSCTIPVAYFMACGKPTPAFTWADAVSFGCAVGERQLFRTAGEISAVYRKDGASCTAVPAQAPFRYVTIGERVWPSDFVSFRPPPSP